MEYYRTESLKYIFISYFPLRTFHHLLVHPVLFIRINTTILFPYLLIEMPAFNFPFINIFFSCYLHTGIFQILMALDILKPKINEVHSKKLKKKNNNEVLDFSSLFSFKIPTAIKNMKLKLIIIYNYMINISPTFAVDKCLGLSQSSL